MSLDIEEGGWFFDGGYGKNHPGSIFNNTDGVNGTSSSSMTFKDLVESILLQNSRSHRVSLLITASFSLAISLLVIAVVIVDAKALQKRSFAPKTKSYKGLWQSVHKAELMPLAIAIAAVIQSAVFLGVQSQALSSLWVEGCTLTAQLIWPAIWIVGFTVTAFSLESTFRSLQALRFEPRGKLHVSVSFILIVLFLLATFITAHLLRSRDVCWGSLVWWTIHYVQPSIALAGGIILVNLVTGATLVLQLMRTTLMCRDERIAASRVVYSLAVNIVILSLLIPFFICYVLMHIDRSASLMADSIVTLNGLLHGVMHLFLRANSEQFAIRPRNTPWTERKPLRLFGPNDLNIHDFISTPLLADRDVERTAFYSIPEKGLLCKDFRSLPREQLISIHPDTSPSAIAVSNPPKRPSSSVYSMFPNHETGLSRAASTYSPATGPLSTSPLKALLSSRPRPADPLSPITSVECETPSDILEPPRPLFKGHKRNDSEMTSETVEIGLRLSSPPDSPERQFSPSIAQPPRAAIQPALLSPDRYVASVKAAEAAKSRPTTLPKLTEVADIREARKPQETPGAVGLPRNPSANKKTQPRSIRDSIAMKTAQSSIDRSNQDKSLPPVPSQERPQPQSTALQTLIQASHTPATAIVQQAKLPVPSWRGQSTTTEAPAPVKTVTGKGSLEEISWLIENGETPESIAGRDGWL